MGFFNTFWNHNHVCMLNMKPEPAASLVKHKEEKTASSAEIWCISLFKGDASWLLLPSDRAVLDVFLIFSLFILV